MAYTNEALGKALEDLTRAYDNFIKNAKDQVVQSLGTEVVNEIKQGVNAYVSSQIDEKIESKVSTAMAGEEAAFLEKVDTKISTASRKLNNRITETSEECKQDVFERFINYFKNGYFQMPGMPSPLEDASLHFEGYSWHEVNYDGNFFRAKGRNAKAFSSVKLTAEQIKNGTYAFGADEQEDAIREIWGHSKTDINFTTGELRPSETGAFLRNYAFNLPYKGNTGDLVYGDLMFRASRVVPTAEENRSRNLTFAFWVLIKNE